MLSLVWLGKARQGKFLHFYISVSHPNRLFFWLNPSSLMTKVPFTSLLDLPMPFVKWNVDEILTFELQKENSFYYFPSPFFLSFPFFFGGNGLTWGKFQVSLTYFISFQSKVTSSFSCILFLFISIETLMKNKVLCWRQYRKKDSIFYIFTTMKHKFKVHLKESRP